MGKNADLMEEIEVKLDSIPMFSKSGAEAVNFDLSGMRQFCDLMGNPQDNFPSIHVAGTNGKGTTCRMLASIYHEAGFKVGLYTSPHLTDVRDRFLVNRTKIEPLELKIFLDRYWPAITEHSFTYFEITTAIAFWHFSRRNVDIAIIETGLGGRLDATNVLNPAASVITTIGLDHTDILGDSISEIAREKSGIVKNTAPVVVGKLTLEALQVVKEVAEQKNVKVFESQKTVQSFQDHALILKLRDIGNLTLKINNGKTTDAENAAIACATVDILRYRFPVHSGEIKKGIENLDQNYPGKGVFHRLRDDKMWYFDGAHNSDSIKALTELLKSISGQENWTVVLSFMSDKLNTEIAEYWNQYSNLWICSQNSRRSASLREMKMYFPGARVLRHPSKNRLPEFKTELVIFSGSFYFYNILSDWMGSGTASDK